MTKKPKGKKPDDNPSGLGTISVGEVYPLPLFMKLTGQGDWAMRKMRRAGLKVRKAGQRSYVNGSDWHAFLKRGEAE